MAGLIPQTFIDDLLDRVDIVEVVDRRVKLKKTGKNYSARCPFHDENSPSFSINPEKQFFYCFGCGAGGNALGFIMDYENLEFPQAVENLADSVGLQVPREQEPHPAQQGQRELYPLLEEAANFYQQQLKQHPQREEAVSYLSGRGLTGEIARHYGMGYAPPGWDNLLNALGTSEERRQQLVKTGMVVENEKGRRYDRFRQRVVFPILDQRGRVIAFGGRVLGDDKPKYLNSPETEIFHKGRELYGLYQARKANRQLQKIVVVEGYMDVIALAQHGIAYAVATLGTATSTTHLEKIYRLCPEVVFCFDGDAAGRKAAERALESALPAMRDGRQARFLFLPDGEDPDTLVRKQGAEHFERLIASSAPLEQYLFDSLSSNLDINSLDGRARLSKLATPLLSKIPAGVYKQLMLNELASRTGLDAKQLQGIVDIEPPPNQDYGQTASSATAQPRQRAPLAGHRVRPGNFRNPVESALALLLHRPDMASEVSETEALRDLPGEAISLLVDMLELLQKRPESTTAMILGHWYNTPGGELLTQLASQERLIPAEGIEKEFSDTIKTLLNQPIQEKWNAQVDKLKGRNYADISEQERLEARRTLDDMRRRNEERRT